MGRYRIHDIKIMNLKHFRGEFAIQLDGKNVLLYGENGSGKSSIYWALHMFYHSCMKTLDRTGAGKYFDPNNTQNLRNAYTDSTAKSGVEITFHPDGGGSSDRLFHDTSERIDTASSPADMFMQFSLQSSDFLSYKSLASLYDFRNSQLCDLTSLFERELFPTMNFSEKLKDLDGNVTDISNISAWWETLESYLLLLPRRSDHSNVYVVKGEEKYAAFQSRLADYNRLLQDSYLDDINRRANNILKDDFNVEYRVELERGEATFNKKLRNPGAKRSFRDNKLTPAKILLKMKWKDDQIPSTSHEIMVEHPQSFFNEAKLTIATFAIRLAIIQIKYPSASQDCAPIICVDDLLISLDMGNRIPVAERILKIADDYQLFIFTHDMSLYNLFMSLIPKDDKKDKWLCYELYNVLDDLNNPASVNPHLCMSKDYMEKAKAAWHNHDIPAAVNYLRKEAEKQLKRLYPKNMQTLISKDWMSLGNMLDKMSEFVRLYSLPSNPIQHMKYFKTRLLNPLSHDDFDAPVYSNELKTCIEELTELSKYEKKVLVSGAEMLTVDFELRMAYGTVTMIVNFQCAEKWDYCYVQGTTAPRYYKNVKVKVVRSSDTMIVPIKDSVPLNEIYKKVYEHLGYTKNTAPKLEDVVTRLTDGKLLKDM